MELPARRDEAIAIYEQVIPLAERLARAQHDSPASADLRAACHNSFASILGRDRFELAKAEYRKAIELRERPDVLAIPGMRNRLAQSEANLGVIYWKERDLQQAEVRFRRAEELLLATVNGVRDPDREAVIAVAQVSVNWVGLLWEQKHNDQAVARANTAIERLESYVRNEPNDQVARELFLKLHGNRGQALSALGRYRESANDWTKVVELSSEPVPAYHRITLALHLLKSGELDRAIAEARLAEKGSALSGEDLYNLACVYTRAVAAVQADEHPGVDDRSRLCESYVSEALGVLRKAAQAGYFRDPDVREQARRDSDLDILRGRPEFRRILELAPGGQPDVQATAAPAR